MSCIYNIKRVVNLICKKEEEAQSPTIPLASILFIPNLLF